MLEVSRTDAHNGRYYTLKQQWLEKGTKNELVEEGRVSKGMKRQNKEERNVLQF